MSILYSGKPFSITINDKVNTYYSDPELNARLGMGEKFYIEARATNVSGTAPTLTVGLETSNDGVNFSARSGSPFINQVAITVGATAVTVLTATCLGTADVGGRFCRVTAKLADTGAPGAFVEIWVTARDAM